MTTSETQILLTILQVKSVNLVDANRYELLIIFESLIPPCQLLKLLRLSANTTK